MPITVDRSRIVQATSNQCPLGQVSLAAYGRQGGTGRSGMRVFGSFAIVLLLRGGGRYHDAKGTDRRVTAGDCIIVLPDLPHSYYPERREDVWDEFYVVFSGPVFDQWQRRAVLSPGKVIHRADPLEYWHAKLTQCATADPLIAVTRVQSFLADLLQANAAMTGAQDEAWLSNAARLIGIGPRPDWQHVAGKLGCGYETFRKRFARLTGQSPAQFHARRVIEHACELLRDPDRSLRDIALDCGFCDEFHFSRRFTKLIGVRPSVLRQQLGAAGFQKE